MREIFNLDNPVWVFLGKLVDMFILSTLWLLCSIPVVTIGASTTALYYVMLKLANDQEGYVVTGFFKAFRANLRQGIVAGLIVLLVAVVLGADFYICFQMEGSMQVMLLWMLVVITVVLLMISVHLFPLIARCDADLKHIFMMAFVIAIKKFAWTIFMIVTAVFFFAAGIFWLAPLLTIAAGGTAYVHSKVLNMIWKDYGLDLEE